MASVHDMSYGPRSVLLTPR